MYSKARHSYVPAVSRGVRSYGVLPLFQPRLSKPIAESGIQTALCLVELSRPALHRHRFGAVFTLVPRIIRRFDHTAPAEACAPCICSRCCAAVAVMRRPTYGNRTIRWAATLASLRQHAAHAHTRAGRGHLVARRAGRHLCDFSSLSTEATVLRGSRTSQDGPPGSCRSRRALPGTHARRRHICQTAYEGSCRSNLRRRRGGKDLLCGAQTIFLEALQVEVEQPSFARERQSSPLTRMGFIVFLAQLRV
ncbi:hypothetical protein PYCCODRAFT_925102 [Trametes coccinea BRFM310]|uniref:Uncharacterized protein n=1 Tax=Trametes coccinea (strain BRFM310) TaxID=1353009 RepID=A0A1Y2J2E1_TRAC3|nr:hypothetical protein PYCCODRAFT_925102 [Trametes coccinea BRFM310]